MVVRASGGTDWAEAIEKRNIHNRKRTAAYFALLLAIEVLFRKENMTGLSLFPAATVDLLALDDCQLVFRRQHLVDGSIITDNNGFRRESVVFRR